MKMRAYLSFLLTIVFINSYCQIIEEQKNCFYKLINISNNNRFFEGTTYSFLFENYDSTSMFIEASNLKYYTVEDTIIVHFLNCGHALLNIFEVTNTDKKYLVKETFDVDYYPVEFFSSIGGNGQRVCKNSFKDKFISLIVKNWNINMSFEVISFDMVINYKNKYLTVHSNSNYISTEQLSYIEKLPNNSIVIFTNIKVQDEYNCSLRNTPTVYFIINNK